MSGFSFNNVGFVGSLGGGAVVTPPAGLPSTAQTLARWSAAEAAGPTGGLDAGNNWPALFGEVTLLNSGTAPFGYSATAPGNVRGLMAAAAGSGFNVAGLTFPNASAASIVVFFSASPEVQVPFEYGPNVSGTPGTFATYVENNTTEHFLNIGGGRTLTANPQLTTRATLLAARYYAAPRSIVAAQNGVASGGLFDEAPAAGGFTAQTLNVGARSGNTFFLKGTLCALHLFHTAPSNADFAAWVAHYNALYAIT